MAGEIDRLEINISADSSDAADHINKLAASLESLGKAAPSVSNSLNGLSIALGSLKGIRTASISRAADSITEAFEKIGNIPNLSAASDVATSINALKEATAGLKEITENIRGLKVGKTFETNLDNLKDAIERLNEISDASNFTGTVQRIAESLSTLNNIEVGQGFFNLVEATTQWQDSIERLNENILGGAFSQGIARVARAAEILNDVDFSGFKRMNQALAALPDNVRVSFGASSEEIQGLTESLENMQRMVDSISTGVTSLASKKTRRTADTTDTNADENIEDIGKASEKAQTMVDAFGHGVIDKLSAVGNLAKKIAPYFSDAARSITSAFASIGKAVAKFSLKAVFAPLTTVANKFKAASVKAGQFIASIKRIAMYRAIRTAIKAVTEGFEEGRKNLYYYSQAVGTDFAPSMDKAATAALYLKNSIGAATAPLTNYLVPMIDKAVDHIVELINKFNELTAVLTKQSTWTAAVKYPTTWQDALDDAEKSAKKLKTTMLGFDELNVIEPASAGVKAKAFDMDDYSRMFKEMQTSATWQNNIPDLLIPVKLAWDSEGDNTIRTIKNTWNEILDLIGAVGESFRTVWMNGTGQKTLELILQITQEIVGTFGALAKKIKEAWQENDKGTKIIQSVWNVANNLLTVFRDIWHSIREWAEGLDWNPLLESLGSLFDAIDKLTAPESGAMQILKGLFDDVLLPLGKWTIEKGVPVAISLLAAAVNFLDDALEKIEPYLAKFWDNFLKPLADWNGTRLIDDMRDAKTLIEDLQKMLNGDKSLKEFISGKFSNATDKDIFEGALRLFNPLMFNSRTFALGDTIAGLFGKKKAEDTESEANSNPTLNQKPVYNAGTSGMTELSVFGNETNNNIKAVTDSMKELSTVIDDVNAKTNTTDSNVTSTWTKIKKSLSDGWDKLKSNVSGFAASWNDNFGAIGEKTYDTWENVKNWLGDNLSWERLKGHINDFASNFSAKFAEMKDEARNKFDNIKITITGFFTNLEIFQKAAKFRDDILDFFRGILGDNSSGITKIFNNIKGTVTSAFNDIKNAITKVFDDVSSSIQSPLDSALNKVYGFINNVTDSIASVFERLKGLQGSARDAFEKYFGIDLENMHWNFGHIGRLANGGMVESGQLFLAREAGPELVGQYGSNSAVMNNAQIVKAVSDGVYRAVTQAMAQSDNRETVVQSHIYLDRKELTAQVQQQEQSNGASIFGDVVYT